MKWFPLIEADRYTSSGSWLTDIDSLTTRFTVRKSFRRFPLWLTAILRGWQEDFRFCFTSDQKQMEVLYRPDGHYELVVDGENLSQWIVHNCRSYVMVNEDLVIMESGDSFVFDSALVYVALHSKKDAMLFKLRFG